MKERFYNWATMWLTLSVIFFLVEYATNWLEVVTLGGLVAGAFIEGFIVNIGLGLMWLIVSKSFKKAQLAEALQQGEIKAAGLDVLCVEPIREDNPLLQIKDSTKLLITPHIAWASVEARYRLLHTIYGQIQEFFGIGE